ncbi:MAG: alpha/beta hydrolase [Caulobacteraceae bacterium]|nr:alpha/beta hydrolase [Caulobacteraceae bacterium]
MLPLRTPKLELLTRQPIPVTSADGLALAAYGWGNPAGREIVFIHGYSQCHLSWRRQMDDAALAAEFRMVAYDLRGQGSSDQPLARERYRDDRLWADDLAAVIAAAGVKRPTLVAWSYGGRVVADYVRFHGQERIAAIDYVAAITRTDRAFWGPALKHTIEMASDDLAANVRAARRFVHACFADRPAGEEMDTTLAYTMVVPAKVRTLVMARTRDEGDILARLRVPVLVTHGTMDRIILAAAGKYTAAHAPGATLSLYDGVGHSPFFEDPTRFNRELAHFVRAADQ